MLPEKVMDSKILKIVLLLLLLADLTYTFHQNKNLNIDGDVASIVVPSDHYSDVLKDPFGFKVLTEKRSYPATNRFFAHATMIAYFKNFHSIISPLFKDKVNAVYFMVGLFNTSIHLLLLLLICVIVIGHFKFWQNDFLLIALLVTPFFQQHGLNSSIGLIDISVTYTFFYALPLSLLIIYFLPFYLSFYHQKPVKNYLKPILYPFWIALAFYLSFSGSIIGPIVITCSPLIVLYICFQKSSPNISIKTLTKNLIQLPKSFIFFWSLILMLGIYSFYIGQFNAEGTTDVSLLQRYKYLAIGLPKFLFHKITFIIIGLILIVNLFIIQKHSTFKLSKKTITLLLTISFICCLYVLLLPLGGYRPYRPWIVRYDTFMPVSIILICMTIFSIKYILWNQLLSKKNQPFYLMFVFAIICFFTISDDPRFDRNNCEKDALYKIAASKEKIIELENQCLIMRWSKIKHPENSETVGEMLYFWDITEQPILFYQKTD